MQTYHLADEFTDAPAEQALLASLAAARGAALSAAGADPVSALAGGYGAAFLVGAGFAALAAFLGVMLLPRSR